MSISKNAFLVFIYLLIPGFNLFAQNLDKIKLANEYYVNNESEKALQLFEDLSRNSKNIHLIHSNYFDLLLKTNAFSKAFKYVNRLQKTFQNNVYYKIDEGLVFMAQGEEEKGDQYFLELIGDIRSSNYNATIAAQYFMSKNLGLYSIKIYQTLRKKSGNPALYALELANAHRSLNDKDGMVQEYLNYVRLNPRNINYVKNILQSLLTEPEDLQSLEAVLYDKAQRFPEETLYNELLVWVKLQQKSFYGALVQAKALDRKLNTPGDRSMHIGIIALENEDYKNAIKAFEHVIKSYNRGPNYNRARRLLITANEGKVKNTFPVQKEDIQLLISQYDQLIQDIGINRVSLEALKNKALLQAYYLDNEEEAVKILNQVIENPASGANLIAEAKLDLGDIFILTEQPWESSLLYSQVEKTNKDTPLAYEAKLRNAKLNYYTGDFSLAKGHLDILKEATTREIANDAIDLSLLITNNTILDTSDFIMKQYANIELLLFKNKTDTALTLLDQMLTDNPGHSISDEVYWLKSKILLQKGAYEKALSELEKISEEYPNDILGDDALFQQAVIHQKYLKNKDVAQEKFQEILLKYPGSLFVAEARKQFRILRGDVL
ncbi:MAG: tetratricopeptide repeat protein [Bacteroidota bacterium]